MIEAPPSAGASKLTTATPSSGVASVTTTVPGMVRGVEVAGANDALSPAALVATTLSVYSMPLVSPVIAHGLDAQSTSMPSGEPVTVYPVTGEPPSSTGATKATEIDSLPGVTTTSVGAPAMVRGVAVAGALATLSPSEFVATTV